MKKIWLWNFEVWWFYDLCICFIIDIEVFEIFIGLIKFFDVLVISLIMEWFVSRSDGGLLI